MPAAAGPKRQLQAQYPVEHLDGLVGGARFVAFAESLTARWGPVVLKDWQRDAASGLYDERPRQAYVQVPRQRGKSFLVALCALYSLLADPEPVNPVVGIIANSERQAQEIMRKILDIVESDYSLSNCLTIYSDRVEYYAGGCRIQVFASSPAGAKGGGGRQIRGASARLMIVDELAFTPDPDLWTSVLLPTIMADPAAMMLACTTPGYKAEGPAWDLYRAHQTGLSPRLFTYVLEAPSEDPDDREAWRIANGDPGDSFMADLEVARSSMPDHAFVREHMGRWTEVADAWFKHGDWDARVAPRRTLEPGQRLWLGFDGSWSGDSTCLVACTEDLHVQVLGFWEKPQGSKKWRVPRDEVDAAVSEAMETFSATLYPDPPFWESDVLRWDQRWPGRVIEFPTNSPARMAPACNTFETVVNDGRLTHDGDFRLRKHIANCVVKDTPHGRVITRATRTAHDQIDLAIGAVLAVSQAALAPPVFEVGCFTG